MMTAAGAAGEGGEGHILSGGGGPNKSEFKEEILGLEKSWSLFAAFPPHLGLELLLHQEGEEGSSS